MTVSRATCILPILVSAIVCGCSKTYTLAEDEWVLIESVEPPVYVRFTGRTAGTNAEYLFQSAESPVTGPITSTVPARYALGRGGVGQTVILGRTTVQYDAYQRPAAREREEYVRFEVVGFDEANTAVKIRVVARSPETE